MKYKPFILVLSLFFCSHVFGQAKKTYDVQAIVFTQAEFDAWSTQGVLAPAKQAEVLKRIKGQDVFFDSDIITEFDVLWLEHYARYNKDGLKKNQELNRVASVVKKYFLALEHFCIQNPDNKVFAVSLRNTYDATYNAYTAAYNFLFDETIELSDLFTQKLSCLIPVSSKIYLPQTLGRLNRAQVSLPKEPWYESEPFHVATNILMDRKKFKQAKDSGFFRFEKDGHYSYPIIERLDDFYKNYTQDGAYGKPSKRAMSVTDYLDGKKTIASETDLVILATQQYPNGLMSQKFKHLMDIKKLSDGSEVPGYYMMILSLKTVHQYLLNKK